MKPIQFKETLWNRLLDAIEQGNIVPIVGPELLTVKFGNKEILLNHWLASELARRLEIDLDDEDAPPTLTEVVCRYQSQPGSDSSEPYYEVFDILRNANFDVPEPLLALARITPLKTFFTTTVDNLLELALQQTRGSASVLSFSDSGSVEDLSTMPTSGTVFHLFGKVNTLPTFVLTEDDLLKFSQKWMDPERRPRKIASLLKNRNMHLMMLGCGFENWLARFFLYGLRSESLFDPQAQKGLIADHRSANDPDLATFLSRCNANLYPGGGAVDFVAELGRRWSERHPTPIPAPKPPEPQQAAKNAIFISYASEDKEIARCVRDALDDVGIDTWFDERRLEGGDEFKGVIVQNIKSSSFFVPIVTRSTLTPEHRFFQFEWTTAIESAKFRPSGHPFILPLVTQDIGVDDDLVPPAFRELHWNRFMGPEEIPEFARQCQQKVRSLIRLSR